MSSDDALKKIAADVLSHTPVKRRGKSNRTLSLDSENFLRLQEHCRSQGVKVSDLLDRLIEAYLNTITDATKQQP